MYDKSPKNTSLYLNNITLEKHHLVCVKVYILFHFISDILNAVLHSIMSYQQGAGIGLIFNYLKLNIFATLARAEWSLDLEDSFTISILQ